MPALAHIIRRRHNRKERRQKQGRRSAIWYSVLLFIPFSLVALPLLAGFGLSIWLYLQAASQMPTREQTVFLDGERGVTSFYERGGSRLIHAVEDPLGEERRWLQLDELPSYLIDAILLVDESDRLAEPEHFDALATALELWRYIIGLPQERADSLTTRLVRDAMLPLTAASGLDGPLLEIVLAAESARLYSAQERLEWRLNSSYYGGGSFGIEAAAQVYLGKPAVSLSLAEAALLAPVAAQPGLNPQDDPLRARERSADLLFALLDAGKIDKEAFDVASAEVVAIREPIGQERAIAADFVDYAREQAEAILTRQGLDGDRLVAGGGLTIRTSLDLDLQLQADCLLRSYLARLQGQSADVSALDGSACAAARPLLPGISATDSPSDSGSLTLIDARNGQILAMVGGAIEVSHQPAIVLQPFVYMDAFLRRAYTPASMVYDLPQSYPGPAADLIYTPVNADGRYQGPLNLRDALAAGLLPPAVQVASGQGMSAGIRMAQALGFNSLDASRDDLELLERGGAVSVLDTAYAYSVLAANGVMRGLATVPVAEGFRGRDPLAVLEIRDAEGRVLWSTAGANADANQTPIVEPSLAYMVNDILADGDARRRVLDGADVALRLSVPAAALDGQSGDGRDSWTVGYTPDLALAVWSGRADEAPLSLEPDQRAFSAPIWQGLLEYALERLDLGAGSWPVPNGIEEYLVCDISGMLPPTTDHCPTRREIVPRGTVLARDDRWETVEINRATGLLATVNTPDDRRESVAYFIPPDEVMAWWLENGRALPPTTYSADRTSAEVKPVQLTAPLDYAYVGATVDISGTINRAGAVGWLLEYGAEVNPDRWITIVEGEAVAEGGEVAATWETALLSGIHTLRLRVRFADGGAESDSKLLTFDNTPPAVRLGTSGGETGIAFPNQRSVSLLADASDNLTIDRVAFYQADALLGIDRDWPYGIEAAVAGVGELLFRAVAFDQVGNRAESVVVVLVEGA